MVNLDVDIHITIYMELIRAYKKSGGYSRLSLGWV